MRESSPVTGTDSGLERAVILPLATLAWLIVGGVAQVVYRPDLAALAWTLGTIPIVAVLSIQIVLSLKRGNFGLDVLAAMSMLAALAFGEHLAAIVVALMYAGGQWLETFAQGRARRDMAAILGRVADTAMRYRDGVVEPVAIDAIGVGDHLLLRHGEVLPVDGRIVEGLAILDQSALTGESLPVTAGQGQDVLSGSTLTGPAVRVVATRPARDSTYAGIIRLVETAQRSKAPMSRLADRYALGFLVLTLVMAGAAWLISGQSTRFLAVLVVATPCPLILAVPIALISGMSNAARHGVLVKTGAAMEALAKVRIAIFDKTGTVTLGRAEVVDILSFRGTAPDEILRLAASLDQASTHVVAEALAHAAHLRRLTLSVPGGVSELAGSGLVGMVAGHAVCVGGTSFVAQQLAAAPPALPVDYKKAGILAIAVGLDGEWAGFILLQDRIRPEASAMIAALKRLGITRMILASGDGQHIADRVAAEIGVPVARGDMLPDDKRALVREEMRIAPVLMTGDGVNDAPALAEATVGVAMGARGAAASSEAAGVVLISDRIAPLVDGVRIAQRTRMIAQQSVTIGLGLSLAGMVFAALGHLAPLEGAVFQEAIDLAVILNALRALR